MERRHFEPRKNWREISDAIGFDFCEIESEDGTPYWTEGVGYHLTSAEVDALDDAANELHAMCMDVVHDIVHSGDYPTIYGLSDVAKQLIEGSHQEPHLYGRFDLALNDGKVKMLEYNADTPTALLEAAVAQWRWKEDLGLPDQFNSIHEKLIHRWKMLAEHKLMPVQLPRLYFTAAGSREDYGTLEYLMDTAVQGGWEVSEIPIEQIGWNAAEGEARDLLERRIDLCFKLYPWEWLLADPDGPEIANATRFIEPAWKMLLSTKALLPVLWERHPNHPLLLPAFMDDGTIRNGRWAHKPMFGREGANVTEVSGHPPHGESTTLPAHFNPAYADSGYVLQQWIDLPKFDGMTVVIGAWVIGDESAGIGVREDRNAITGNDSHFVPHYFD